MKVEVKELLEPLKRFQDLNLSADKLENINELVLVKNDYLYGLSGSCAGRIKMNTDLGINQVLRFKEFFELFSNIKNKEVDIAEKNKKVFITTNRINVELNTFDNLLYNLNVPVKWTKLPEDFLNGVRLCASSTISELSAFANLKVTKESLLSCDNVRISKHIWKDPMKIKEGFLIPVVGIKKLIKFNPTKTFIDKDDIYFINKHKDILCLRKTHKIKEFRDVEKMLKETKTTSKIQLPLKLKDNLLRAGIFGNDEVSGLVEVLITINKNQLLCEAKCPVGKIKEKSKIEYSGKKIQFIIHPDALVEILNRESEKEHITISIGENSLLFKGNRFLYIVSILKKGV